jgi:predicted ATPase
VASKLTSVELTNFLSIRSAKVELGDLNVLIGANGAGKSNFLAFFDMMSSLVNGRLRNWVGARGGSDRVLFGGVKTSETGAAALRWSNRSSYATSLLPSFENLWLANETMTGTAASGIEQTIALDTATSESNMFAGPALSKSLGHDASDSVLAQLALTRRNHFSDIAGPKRPQYVEDAQEFRSDGANLAPFLLWMRTKHPVDYERIRYAVSIVAPYFEDFDLRPSPYNETLVSLTWRHRDSDMYADASTLSDGTLRFICLATLLLQPDPPGLIVIDEPELGLHPFALRVVAELLQSAAARTQVIVATQSVTLVDQFPLECIITTDRIDGSTSFKRLDEVALRGWLEDYSVGELWEKNLLGASPQGV